MLKVCSTLSRLAAQELGIRIRVTARTANLPRTTHDNADVRLRRFFKTESLKFIPFSVLFICELFAPAVCKTPLIDQYFPIPENILLSGKTGRASSPAFFQQ
jgi:hypothetical protein